MQPEHEARIDSAVHALIESMHKCWGHFHLLQGLHEGCKAHPRVITEHNDVLMQIWKAAFQALFAAAGTLLDTRKDTSSIHSALTLLRRFGDAEDKAAAEHLGKHLKDKSGDLHKVREWRHNSIAHWTEEARDLSFYERNRLNLREVEVVLQHIEALINAISMRATATHNTIRPASEDLVEETTFLLLSLDLTASIQPVGNPTE